MKSFIRVITIIIVLTFILTTSAMAQSSAGVVIEDTLNDDEILAPHSIDPLVQLRTLLSTTNQQYGGGKVLVIPTAQIQPQDMVTLMEDMTVMCRIFDKSLERSLLRRGAPLLGRVTFRDPFSLGSRSMGAMYIQGYGALFMRTVDFPLLPPPETEEKEDTKVEDADPVWEQMKQEIFSPEQAARRAPDRQEKKYDAEKVENLKTTLIKALEHAANIRGLKPDESVILTITGSGISSNSVKVTAIPGHNQVMVTYKDKNKNVTKLLDSPSLNDLGISTPTVLTIRAKKSYIDALAEGKIDFDKFEQKIQLLTYPSLGENLNRGSSPYFLPSGSTGYSWPSSTQVDISESSSVNRRRRSSGRQQAQ
ncbi:MAG: hypothetical protein GY774_21700 [Planctomycetes bacterium]|nr:hypothetical protein [Planctomycetota bacterium]